ncbi:MAG: CCDC90 family protein [Acidimicrobiales bacterium]|nr:CCDC90 family protein [Acidimicrobiales bacterium]
MALDARTRSSIFEKLRPILGDEDANALMSEFPASELDELVTRQYLRAEMAELRAEVQAGFAELRAEIAGVRQELRDEIAGVRLDLDSKIVQLRVDMIEGFRQQSERLRQQTVFTVGSLFGAVSAAVALTQLLR